MSLDALIAWLRTFLRKPPAMPKVPDLRTIAAPPRELALVPKFNRAWAAALADVQQQVADWANGAWEFLTSFNAGVATEAIRLGLGVGLLVGLMLGFLAGVSFYARLTTTLANRRALEK